MENFIEEYSIDTNVCKELIKFFNKIPLDTRSEFYRKAIGQVAGNRVIKSIKDSTDLVFSNKLLLRIGDIDLRKDCVPFSNVISSYVKELTKCMIQYKTKYPYCIPDGSQVKLIEDISLQHYGPGQGYPRYHCERSSTHKPISSRHLVFMTYLNTVTDKGGTEFYHQNKITKAIEGKTVIWVADWTYTHRGIISPTQNKYIITGWYNLVN